MKRILSLILVAVLTLSVFAFVGCGKQKTLKLGLGVYTTVSALTAGEVVDVEGFLYWYEGANPHITSVKVVG